MIINENEEGSPSGRNKPKMRYILITRKHTTPTFWLRKKASTQNPIATTKDQNQPHRPGLGKDNLS